MHIEADTGSPTITIFANWDNNMMKGISRVLSVTLILLCALPVWANITRPLMAFSVAMKLIQIPIPVIPAKAGIHGPWALLILDSRLRGNDE